MIREQVLERRDRRRTGPAPVAPAAVEARAREADVAEERAEHDRVAALGAEALPAGRAMPAGGDPGRGLQLDDPALEAAEHGLALGERQADLLQPVRALLEGGHLLRRAELAVIRCCLEQDPDPHGIPPCLVPELSTGPGEESPRPFRSAAHEGGPCLVPPAAGMSLDPERRLANPPWAASSASPAPSPPSSPARASTPRRAGRCSKPPAARPASSPRPSAGAPSTG